MSIEYEYHFNPHCASLPEIFTIEELCPDYSFIENEWYDYVAGELDMPLWNQDADGNVIEDEDCDCNSYHDYTDNAYRGDIGLFWEKAKELANASGRGASAIKDYELAAVKEYYEWD